MATYNGAAYIQDQLDSFLHQTRLPSELAVSDDGSTDETLNILHRFQSRAPFPVHIIEGQPRLGYAGNFGRALMATKGDWVFLSDQDDVWFDNKIEVMLREAARHPHAQLVMCNATLADQDMTKTRLTALGQTRTAGLPDTAFVLGCCMSIRRDLLQIALPIPAKFPSHDDWLIRIADGMKSKLIHAEPLQAYRRHGLNQSQSYIHRLTRVNRITCFANRLHRLFHVALGHEQKTLKDILDMESMLLQAADRALASRGEDNDHLFRFRNQQSKRVDILQRRKDALRYRSWKRLFAIYRLWKNGDYATFLGLATGVADFLTPPLMSRDE